MTDFKVLSDREHTLMRPGIYLGSTTAEDVSGIINFQYSTKKVVPALIKMIEEIYQNSVDEHIRTEGKYADKIDVSFGYSLEGDEISVTDNGRGIPQELIDGVARPVLAWTTLRAGSNFDDSKRVGAGTNGMGAALTNIFSKQFVGKTCDGKTLMVVECSDNMNNIKSWTSKEKSNGTSVSFIPDLERFGMTSLDADHVDLIRDRIENLAICYKTIQFSFNTKPIKFKTLKDVAKRFSDDALVFDHGNISLIIAPSGVDEEFRCLSYVNGINIKNGGSHVDYVMNKITDAIRTMVKKKMKIDVLPNQIKQHLLLASWASGFKNLRFDSQSKERITNTVAEVSEFFKDVDFEVIAKKVLASEAIIEPIVSAQLRKKEALEAAELAKKNKEIDKGNLRKIVKFTDASEQTKRRDCMLMICEGDSANSSILSARTSLIGSYPLRGKPINVMGATLKELMENKEFSDILKVTGLKIGVPVRRIDDVRFGKIVFTTDADLDGNGITGLQIAMFRRFWPEMFEFGMIYRFRTPIMKVLIGKKEIYFDTLDQFEQWAEKETKPFKTRYLKGLGSSTTADFKYYFSEIESRLEKITIKDHGDFDLVDMVYTKESGAADKRKTWLGLQE